MATVLLPAALRRYAGDAAAVEVSGATVGEAFAHLFAAHPELQPRMVDRAGRLPRHLLVFLGEDRLPAGGWASVPLAPSDVLRILMAVGGGAEDVRMKGFRRRSSVTEARAAALAGVKPLPAEDVPLAECAGRVAAAPVSSDIDVPLFPRATMDGYAVRAVDTVGASAYGPIILTVAGESMPGKQSGGSVGPGRAFRIMTGAPIPEGADAVLRAEDAVEAGDRLEVTAPVAGERNIGRVGEDVHRGEVVVPAGRRLLPQDVGLLSSIGCARVAVHRQPRVRIIVSGNELVPAGERPSAGRIADSNGPMLAALVARDGGRVEQSLRLPDDREALRQALAAPGADVIVTAGAASVGREDWVPVLVSELGSLDIHGVAMRPSSPTGIGRIGGAVVLLLPGNPVSCLVAYDFFAGPVVRTLGALPRAVDFPYARAFFPLASRLVSQVGRTDYARVRIVSGRAEPVAIGGASVLSSVTAADGFVIVPEPSEGFPEGAEIEVHLYREPAGT